MANEVLKTVTFLLAFFDQMLVGTEWLIEAYQCDAERLRRLIALRQIFEQIIGDLQLKVIGEINWHQFGGAGGITGLAMLTESHLACHTYPEHRTATFNLYCCRTRPEWNWAANLKDALGATVVIVTEIKRGNSNYVAQSSHSDTETQTLKSAGGEA